MNDLRETVFHIYST